MDSSSSPPSEPPPVSLSTPEEALIPRYPNPWKTLPERYQIKAAVLARLFAMVLSLVSFSLMAASGQRNRRGDSFDESMEYPYKQRNYPFTEPYLLPEAVSSVANRFCITTNVLVFVYSTFQAFATVYPILFGENIVPLPWKLYFDFALDQVLAYLLIAAGASAAAIIKKTGNYSMANAAVSMAFLAFAGLAFSATVSALTLSRYYSISANKEITA